MDPNETLAELREAFRKADEAARHGNDAKTGLYYGAAAAHFEALDDFLTRGGFPPVDWDRRFTETRKN